MKAFLINNHLIAYVIFVPVAIVIIAALLGIVSYTSKNRVIHAAAWIIALLSLFACNILKDTYFCIYATTAVATAFIALLARAEMRSSGWYSIIWSLLLAIALLTITCIIAEESVKRIGIYTYHMLMAHHHVGWLEDAADYLFPLLFIGFSIALDGRLLGRVQKLTLRNHLVWSMALSIATGLGLFICFILYSTMGTQCFPYSLGDFISDTDFYEFTIVFVGLTAHGWIVFILDKFLAKRNEIV